MQQLHGFLASANQFRARRGSVPIFSAFSIPGCFGGRCWLAAWRLAGWLPGRLASCPMAVVAWWRERVLLLAPQLLNFDCGAACRHPGAVTMEQPSRDKPGNAALQVPHRKQQMAAQGFLLQPCTVFTPLAPLLLSIESQGVWLTVLLVLLCVLQKPAAFWRGTTTGAFVDAAMRPGV